MTEDAKTLDALLGLLDRQYARISRLTFLSGLFVVPSPDLFTFPRASQLAYDGLVGRISEPDRQPDHADFPWLLDVCKTVLPRIRDKEWALLRRRGIAASAGAVAFVLVSVLAFASLIVAVKRSSSPDGDPLVIGIAAAICVAMLSRMFVSSFVDRRTERVVRDLTVAAVAIPEVLWVLHRDGTDGAGETA